MELYERFLPHAWTNWIYSKAGKKHTILFSNVPGFLEQVNYGGGSPAKRFFTLGSGPSNLATSINIVSIHKRAQVCVTSDESQIEDVPKFVGYFSEIIEELGIEYNEEEEGTD